MVGVVFLIGLGLFALFIAFSKNAGLLIPKMTKNRIELTLNFHKDRLLIYHTGGELDTGKWTERDRLGFTKEGRDLFGYTGGFDVGRIKYEKIKARYAGGCFHFRFWYTDYGIVFTESQIVEGDSRQLREFLKRKMGERYSDESDGSSGDVRTAQKIQISEPVDFPTGVLKDVYERLQEYGDLNDKMTSDGEFILIRFHKYLKLELSEYDNIEEFFRHFDDLMKERIIFVENRLTRRQEQYSNTDLNMLLKTKNKIFCRVFSAKRIYVDR